MGEKLLQRAAFRDLSLREDLILLFCVYGELFLAEEVMRRLARADGAQEVMDIYPDPLQCLDDKPSFRLATRLDI